MLEHKQIYIKSPWKEKEVGVDEEIVALIQELWRLGIKTTTCCQDVSGGRRPGCEDVWIGFEPEDFAVFAKGIVENVGIQWHILPRPNPVDRGKLIIGLCFPSTYYDRVLSYFKSQGV